VKAGTTADKARRAPGVEGWRAYFEGRGLKADTVRRTGVAYAAGAFAYPCRDVDGRTLAIHYKSEVRDAMGKRRQWWGGYADNLPARGYGTKPEDPAKVVPFGLETLRDLAPGSLVILCCGQEDAMSLRQVGYTAVSQPGAGLLEPTYAARLAGFRVVVFYDSGEEVEAHKDALKLSRAGAKEVRIAAWPPEVPNGADINGRLVEDPETFGDWTAEMIASARPPSVGGAAPANRGGEPDGYHAGRDARNPEASVQIGKLLSEVEPEAVEWLWPGRLPAGKLIVWEGDPGLGKSVATVDVAARLSTGRGWPDGPPCESGGAVICSAEDGLADTIRPRLDAAGGDPERVLALVTVADGDAERPLSIPEDLGTLRRGIERVGAKLVIVDPLMAFLSGRHDAHKDQDIRRALAPLARLAEETGATVLVVRHLTKTSGGNPLYRGGGSIGIVGAARAAFLLAKHPEDENLRVLAPVKNNLAACPPSLTFALAGAANGAVRIEWRGETHHSADALLAAPADPEERSALEEAKDFLKEALKDGPRGAKAVTEEAREAEISGMTLKRARQALGVTSKKQSDGSWSWRFPEGKGIEGARVPGSDRLDPLDPLPAIGPLSKGQGDQGGQGGLPSYGERLGSGGNDHHPGERCIHDVAGGCWLCHKGRGGAA
jgi:hypothetical protein